MPYQLESHTGPLPAVIEAYNKRDEQGWVLVQFAVVPGEPPNSADTYVSVWWKEGGRRGRPRPQPAPVPATPRGGYPVARGVRTG